jgi:hypothetical protein
MEIHNNNIYTGNWVSDEAVDAVNQLLDTYGAAVVHFDVMGRTKHGLLAHELYSKLDQDTVEATIEYNYICEFTLKERTSSVNDSAK